MNDILLFTTIICIISALIVIWLIYKLYTLSTTTEETKKNTTEETKSDDQEDKRQKILKKCQYIHYPLSKKYIIQVPGGYLCYSLAHGCYETTDYSFYAQQFSSINECDLALKKYLETYYQIKVEYIKPNIQ